MLPWVVNNLVGMYRQSQRDERAQSAREALGQQMLEQYSTQNGESGMRDPAPLLQRAQAVADVRGGQAGFEYLLGQTDPQRLAQLQAQQHYAQRQRMEMEGTQQRFQQHQQLTQPGALPQDMQRAISLMTPQQAGQTLVPARAVSTPSEPAAIREYRFLQSLTPEQQKQFFAVKRGQQTIGLGGGGTGLLDPTGDLRTIVSSEQFGRGKGEAEVSAKEQTRQYTENVALPQIQAEAQNTIGLVNQVLEHPGFSTYYGKTSVLPIVPGSDTADFQTFVEQAGGKTFMEAYQGLRGSGSITEIESRKAEQAIARIANRNQSDESARQAWEDLRDVVMAGLKRRQESAKKMYDVRGQERTSPLPRPGETQATRRYVPGQGFVEIQ